MNNEVEKTKTSFQCKCSQQFNIENVLHEKRTRRVSRMSPCFLLPADFLLKTSNILLNEHGTVIEMHDEISAHLSPIFVQGTVVTGFGRGSKELGIPTANYPEEVVEKYSESLNTGIYCGWARVNGGEVHKMVMSVGWNPYYKNNKKSMETHIIHTFDQDFYGSQLSLVIVGHLRPEKTYLDLQALIDAIHGDISQAKELLDKPEHESFKMHKFFTTDIKCLDNGVENG